MYNIVYWVQLKFNISHFIHYCHKRHIERVLYFFRFCMKQSLSLSNKMLNQINIYSLFEYFSKKNLNRLWKMILFQLLLHKAYWKNKVLFIEWILITLKSKQFFPKLYILNFSQYLINNFKKKLVPLFKYQFKLVFSTLGC